MWSKVSAFIKKYKLLETNGLYVVALSGGADSVALLRLLVGMGYSVHAAHVNFHLRGDESERDERFCIDLCQQMGVELHRAHFDTLTYAQAHQVSVEMAARELRYRWFEQLRQDIGADAVCVAHHRDDSVETVLLNLVRGTGLRGLCGIRPINGYIVRPLLCVSRDDIEAYLDEIGQAYVTDSTNLEDEVLRNKIRLNVIPLLKTVNSAAVEHIQQTADNLLEAQRVLDAVCDGIKENKSLEISKLYKYGSSEYVVYEWLKNYGFNGTQVRQMLAAATGSVFSSQQGYDVLVDRERLLLEPSLKPMKPLRIPETGTYVVDNETKLVVGEEAAWVSKHSLCATVDAGKVAFPLTVRRVCEGDKMIPFGMKGGRLLSDMMTDLKMTVFEKRRQLVVLDSREHVVWLVGVRTDDRFRVDGSTSRVLTLKVLKTNTMQTK